MRSFSPLGVLTSVMNAFGTGLVLLIMLVILGDVLGRYFLNRPLPGTPEIVSMSIAVIVFLQFPSTLRAGRVINSDGFLDLVGRRSIRCEQCLLGLYHLVGGVMFSVVCLNVLPLAQESFANGDYYGMPSVFTFPRWPVFSVITFGCAVMVLQYVVLAGQYFRSGAKRERLFVIDPANKVIS